MDGYHIYPDPAPGGKTPWPLIASSLWLRLGFVAATGAVVALTELYKGELNVLAALAWIFGGAWLTALSWRRAKFLLDRLDGPLTDEQVKFARWRRITDSSST